MQVTENYLMFILMCIPATIVYIGVCGFITYRMLPLPVVLPYVGMVLLVFCTIMVWVAGAALIEPVYFKIGYKYIPEKTQEVYCSRQTVHVESSSFGGDGCFTDVVTTKNEVNALFVSFYETCIKSGKPKSSCDDYRERGVDAAYTSLAKHDYKMKTNDLLQTQFVSSWVRELVK